jgi:H+/Cl- antiporter ClcA
LRRDIGIGIAIAVASGIANQVNPGGHYELLRSHHFDFRLPIAIAIAIPAVLGLVLGKHEAPAAFFKEIDEAKKAIGTDNVAIVTQNSLWENAGREQILGVRSEFLKIARIW